jgi:hypothetical protein
MSQNRTGSQKGLFFFAYVFGPPHLANPQNSLSLRAFGVILGEGLIDPLYLRYHGGSPLVTLLVATLSSVALSLNTVRRGKFTLVNQLIGLLPILCGSLAFFIKKGSQDN